MNNPVVGSEYRWKNKPQNMYYMGKADIWFQFALVGTDVVWCELLQGDLKYLVEA